MKGRGCGFPDGIYQGGRAAPNEAQGAKECPAQGEARGFAKDLAQRKEREFTMTTTVTRRDLFKFGGLAALGVAGASTLAGCGQPKTVAEAAAEKAELEKAANK